jgi:hypothetical protein
MVRSSKIVSYFSPSNQPILGKPSNLLFRWMASPDEFLIVGPLDVFNHPNATF